MRSQMRAKALSSPGPDRSARGQQSVIGLAPIGTAFVLLLAGCTSLPQQATQPAPGFGASVNQNAAVMIIDPQPVRAQDTALPLDGHRAENAIIRYYTGQVIPPEALTTSGIGSAAGGGAPGVATAASTGAVQ